MLKKPLEIIGALTVGIVVIIGVLIGGFYGYNAYSDYQLQNPIYHELKNASSKKLTQLSANHKTAQFLKTHRARTVSADSLDNQGWKQDGYYTGQINGRNVMIDAKLVNNSSLHPKYKLTKIALN